MVLNLKVSLNKYQLFYFILKYLGVFQLMEFLNINNSFILCYHRISIKKFESHILFYKKRFNVLPLKNLLHKNYFEPKDSHMVPISITMDDCYSNEFKNAFYVSNLHKVHCTYFIPTKYSKEEKSLWPLRLITFLQNLLVPKEIIDFNGEKVLLNDKKSLDKFEKKWVYHFLFNEMQTGVIEKIFDDFYLKNNVIDISDPVLSKEQILEYKNNLYTSFQSHTVSHVKLYLLSETELKSELGDSKKYLEELIEDYPQYVFCYPYGTNKHIGTTYENIDKYYQYSVTLQSGVIDKETPPNCLPRIGIYEHDNEQSIMLKIAIARIKQYFKNKNKRK